MLSTLLIALVVWLAGAAFAQRFGHIVDTVSSLALIAFGSWFAIPHGAICGSTAGTGTVTAMTFLISMEVRRGTTMMDNTTAHTHDEHDHETTLEDDLLYAPIRGETVITRHVHTHRHGRGSIHRHWHDHTPTLSHAITVESETAPPAHDHRHKTTARTALLLILGSSPMVEGIPAFFAAGKWGSSQQRQCR